MGPVPRAVSVGAALIAACFALWAPVAAQAQPSFEIKGRGYGHGIGLSQYGAQGYAQHGKSADWIVGHYYPGTRLGDAPSKKIGVLLTGGSRSYRFSGARRACGTKVSPRRSYEAVTSGKRVSLASGGSKIKSCRSLDVSGKGGVEVAGVGSYRGHVVFKRTSGSLNVINRLDIDQYVRGVVAAEMPSSWESEALAAQAIVARSYALATSVDGDGYDVYDDTRSQVYSGKSGETAATNAAVKSTKGKVVLHRGQVATTYFFSTSGGRTEAIENAWPGASPVPYLTSVADRYDSISPVSRWNESFGRSELQSKLGSWVEGRLRGIKILKTGETPRVVRAKIVGSGGSTTVSGPDIRSRLGLRSTWFKVKRS